MTKLGENVFRFNSFNNLFRIGFCGLILFIVWGYIRFIFNRATYRASDAAIFNGASAYSGSSIFKGIVSIIVVGLIIYLIINFLRYMIMDHVILDKDKGVLTLYKYSWKFSHKFENIPLNEIMGTSQDADITTKTEFKNNSWRTTENKIFYTVVQGKFGSRRFRLANKGDWDLFMTLLYGE